MKKITCIALTIAALLSALPTQAQFSWGVKGGVNLGNNDLTVLTSWKSAFDQTSYTGFFIGPKIEVRIPVLGFGIEAAALYAQKGLSLTNDDTFKQNSIQIPLNIKYSFGLGNSANIFIAGGPEFGFNVGQKLTHVKLPDGTARAYIIDKSALSINAGLGFTIANHFQVGINYNMPWGKTGEFVYISKEELENAESMQTGENITYEAIEMLLQTKDKLENAVQNIKSGTIQVTIAYLF